MRIFILMCTAVGVLALGTLEAGGFRKIDVGKQIGLLKTSTSARERAAAAEELGRRGAIRARDVKDAIDPLLAAVKSDTDAEVRRAAAKAIGDISPDATKAVPVLTDALKDKSVTVKMAAAMALAQYGGEARSALPALRELANNKGQKKLSQTAKMAMKSIGGKKK